jgi:hypothetical protein
LSAEVASGSEKLLTIPRNRCSRSSEIHAHVPLKSALTIPRNTHFNRSGKRSVDDRLGTQPVFDQARSRIKIDRFLLIGDHDVRLSQFSGTDGGIFISLPQVSA